MVLTLHQHSFLKNRSICTSCHKVCYIHLKSLLKKGAIPIFVGLCPTEAPWQAAVVPTPRNGAELMEFKAYMTEEQLCVHHAVFHSDVHHAVFHSDVAQQK